MFYFKKKLKNIYLKKKKEEKIGVATPKPPLGVVSATPLGPWGWPSHPLMPKGHPKVFFLFFIFFFLL
jgi:hypothetical protein